MGHSQVKAYLFLTLICSTSIIIPVLSAPPQHGQGEGRKFVSKPNSPKKVYHKQHIINQLDNPEQAPMISSKLGESNSVLPESNGQGGQNIAWAIAGPLMQLIRLFFNIPTEMPNGNSLTTGTDKMDTGITNQGFSWGQVIGYGLKLLLAAMGGGANGHDGIDKVDAGATPMQGLMKSLIGALVGNEDINSNENMAKQTSELINLVMALLNAMKTSFSQRAMRARSLGGKDRLTEISLASIDMGKAFARTFNTTNEVCRQQYICLANRDCVNDVVQPDSFGLCHFAAYATANLMYYTQPNESDKTKIYLEAARRGRSAEDCHKQYVCEKS